MSTDPRQIQDAEVRILAAISAQLEADYTEGEDAWAGSPFAWIKTRPSRQVGAIGEKLVAGWLAARDFNIARSPDSDADRIVERKRVEIKFSTQWKNGGYKFQQLRDQNYDIAICLGVTPFDAHCWVLPKTAILHHWHTAGNIASQHGGASGKDTAWIAVDDPYRPAPWMNEYGGRLKAGLECLSRLTGFTPPDPNEEELE
jgi:hypothetical protein